MDLYTGGLLMDITASIDNINRVTLYSLTVTKWVIDGETTYMHLLKYVLYGILKLALQMLSSCYMPRSLYNSPFGLRKGILVLRISVAPICPSVKDIITSVQSNLKQLILEAAFQDLHLLLKFLNLFSP